MFQRVAAESRRASGVLRRAAVTRLAVATPAGAFPSLLDAKSKATPLTLPSLRPAEWELPK